MLQYVILGIDMKYYDDAILVLFLYFVFYESSSMWFEFLSVKLIGAAHIL